MALKNIINPFTGLLQKVFDDSSISSSGLSLDTTLDSSGITLSFTAGENLIAGDICYLKSDGKFWKANSTDNTKIPCTTMATATILADASGIFLFLGTLKDGTLSLTVGGNIYVSTTDGTITQTAPSSSGNIVQVIGIALSATVIYFNPNSVTVEVA